MAKLLSKHNCSSGTCELGRNGGHWLATPTEEGRNRPAGKSTAQSFSFALTVSRGDVNFRAALENPRNPVPTVDAIIETSGGIVLIKRRFPPPGWALPGGFVEYGETVEAAAVREAREETGLQVTLTELFGVYSDPRRDPRRHTIAVVFIGRASGTPVGGDDAVEARVFTEQTVPAPLAFDHANILAAYFAYKHTGQRPRHDP